MREVRGLIPRISTTFLWLKIQKSEWSGKWNFLILLIFLFSSKKKINYITHAVSLSLNTRSQLTRQRSTYYYELSERERVWVLSQFLLTPKITITWRGLNTLLIKIQIEKNYLVLSLSLSAIYVSVYQFLLRVLICFVSDRTAGGGGASTSSPRTVTLFSLTSHFPFLLKR